MTTRILKPRPSRYDDLSLDLVKHFDADPRGAVNAVESLNAFWERIRLLAKNNRVPTKVLIPPGEYLLDVGAFGSAVDWTNLVAFTLTIEAAGAIFYAKGSGYHAIEGLNVRGFHINGLVVVGDEDDPPESGMIVGPQTTNTCGNNYFDQVTFTGHFNQAAFWNLGSETTNYSECWFINKKVDPDVFAYLGDGVNRFGATSDHETLRSSGVNVSYTNNAFRNNCRLECADGGGTPFYLEGSSGWDMARDTYLLGYASGMKIRQDSTSRHSNLNLGGLFESSAGSGLDVAVEFIIPNGVSSAIEVGKFDFGTPNCSESFFKLTDPSAGTPGSLLLRGVEVITNGPASGLGDVPIFDANGGSFSFAGRLWCKNGASINLDELTDYGLEIFTSDASEITFGVGQATVYDTDEFINGTYKDTIISSSQLLALNATPQTLVPAPGSGKALVFRGAYIHYDYNSAAYAGIAAGEDLVVRYTNGSGVVVGFQEATGFLDQTADVRKWIYPTDTTGAVLNSITIPSNSALVLHMLTGEITTGDSPLNIRVFYDIIDTNTLV